MKVDPIIFVHNGNHEHLKVSINQLLNNNKEAEIILIGDDLNSKINGISHYHFENYFKSAKEFENNSYIHMSKNNYQFELFCYQRWFVLHEFVEKNGIEYFWYLDSDFLVYENLHDYLLKQVKDYSIDVIGFDSVNSGIGDSFMPCFNRLSLKAIRAITAYFKKSYEDKDILAVLKMKWKNHLVKKLPGGVCDMTQLKMLFDDYKGDMTIYNSYDYNLNLIPDGNINSRYNYFSDNKSFRTFLGVKYVRIKDKKAYGYLEDGKQVYFLGSHFQGRAKRKMVYYARDNYTPKNFSNIVISSCQNLMKRIRYFLIKKVKRLVA